MYNTHSAAFVQAFFADIYAEARKAKPSLGHKALAQIAGAHKLLRHYTMNIDGLAESAGMDTWQVDNNPTGQSITAATLTLGVNILLCSTAYPPHCLSPVARYC